MSNKLLKATAIATGKKVEVYKLTSGEWCDYSDCKTTYTDFELQFNQNNY